ncbi:MAG: hypothetical protein ACRYGG_07660 [Janthinobacterium lividum]
MAGTGISLGIREEIIKECVFAVLNRPNTTSVEGGSFWMVMTHIYEDRYVGIYNDKNIKTVQFIRKTNPELYKQIKPWIEYKKREDR